MTQVFNVKISDVINIFHDLYHNNHIGKVKWFGYNVTKSPIDCWVYQEIIHETQPDVIIECGTGEGGSHPGQDLCGSRRRGYQTC